MAASAIRTNFPMLHSPIRTVTFLAISHRRNLLDDKYRTLKQLRTSRCPVPAFRQIVRQHRRDFSNLQRHAGNLCQMILFPFAQSLLGRASPNFRPLNDISTVQYPGLRMVLRRRRQNWLRFCRGLLRRREAKAQSSSHCRLLIIQC